MAASEISASNPHRQNSGRLLRTKKEEEGLAPIAVDITPTWRRHASSERAGLISFSNLLKQGGENTACPHMGGGQPKSSPCRQALPAAFQAWQIPNPPGLQQSNIGRRSSVDSVIIECTNCFETAMKHLLEEGGVQQAVRTRCGDIMAKVEGQLRQVQDAQLRLARQKEATASQSWLHLRECGRNAVRQPQSEQESQLDVSVLTGSEAERRAKADGLTSAAFVSKTLCEDWFRSEGSEDGRCHQDWLRNASCASDASVSCLVSALKDAGGAVDARHDAELIHLRSKLSEITRHFAHQEERLIQMEKGLTRARAQVAVLTDELRKRGGTRHYSNLTVKLGIAEAEIRSLTARKRQLAVKLAHVEREREEALHVPRGMHAKYTEDRQADAETVLYKRLDCAVIGGGSDRKGMNHRRPWQAQLQPAPTKGGMTVVHDVLEALTRNIDPRPHPGPLEPHPSSRVDLKPVGGNHSTTLDTLGTNLGMLSVNQRGAEKAQRASQEDEGAVEFINRRSTSADAGGAEETEYQQTWPPEPPRSSTPIAIDEKVDIEGKSAPESRLGKGAAARSTMRVGLPAGSVGSGRDEAAGRRSRGGVAPSAAVEKARASERRCLALLAAVSQELEAEKTRSKRLRYALILLEEKKAPGIYQARADKLGDVSPSSQSLEQDIAVGDVEKPRMRKTAEGASLFQSVPRIVGSLILCLSGSLNQRLFGGGSGARLAESVYVPTVVVATAVIPGAVLAYCWM